MPLPMAYLLETIYHGLQGTLAVAVLFTIGSWWATLQLRKQLTGLLIRWDKPAFGVWTAVLFMLVLVFLSGGMLAYAFSIRLFPTATSSPLWADIASLCFLHVSVLILLFAGLRGHHLYILSERGIYNTKFIWQRMKWDVELIPWEEVYDYYYHEDGALIRYSLLLRDKRKIILEVPTHLKDLIERVIVLGTEKYSFLRKYSEMIRRYYSES